MIRAIFPYCHHKNPKKPCLFVHLGLCPYPYANDLSQKAYKNTISQIKKLLSKKSQTLLKELKREMAKFSKGQQYEQANELKNQIQKLQYITTTYKAPQEFLERPTLVDDLRLMRLEEMKKVLGLSKIPKRIECYDIANISGVLATGSMVVFTNGQPDKSQYRKFKIKFTKKPNDYEMLREVLTRRFKNDWPIADLMIIDGGKGQLSAALSVVFKYKVQTFVTSLAKRFEQIYTQDRKEPISLPKENPARQLAQEARDEAHRFTNAYHKLLRSKKMLAS